MNQKISIAIDGPAGSGKSTIAKRVALHFGYVYVDTGAMYRAVTLKALEQGISFDDPEKMTRLAAGCAIELRSEDLGGEYRQRVFLDGSDVSEAIRSLKVTNQVSFPAALPGVRAAMVKLQCRMAAGGGVVMDGRDIGTVVLPDAELKVFLTASASERSKRRWLELREKGTDVDIDELEEQIRRRDEIDSTREADPLRQAEDAVLLDTSSMNIDEVVAEVLRLAEERIKQETEARSQKVKLKFEFK
jgi:cytidylate kinase